MERPIHLVFAEGDWFSSPEIPKTDISSNIITTQQGLNGSARMEIICVNIQNDDQCTDNQRAFYSNYLQKTAQDFSGRQLGRFQFPEPRLKTTGPLSDYDYKVYMEPFRQFSNEDGEKCTGGRYSAFGKILTICIYPIYKVAPMIKIHSVEPGDSFKILFDGVPRVVIAASDDDAMDIAKKFADSIQANRPSAALIAPYALAIGDRISLFYARDGRNNLPIITVTSPSTEKIEILPFEQRSLWTTNHEYFHSLQRAANYRRSNFYYIEGTATAASRSVNNELNDRSVLSDFSRDYGYSIRKLNVPHFRHLTDADSLHYAGQDFYIFVSRFLNVGIEWITPMMSEGGGLADHRNTLAYLRTPLRFIYSKYARNSFIEKQIKLDTYSSFWDDRCTPQTNAFSSSSDRRKTYEYSTSTPSTTIPMKQYSAGLVEITFPPSYYGQSFLIEAYGDGGSQNTSWMNTSIYKESYSTSTGENCVYPPLTRSNRVVNVDIGNNKFYAFGVATEHDETMHVKIRPIASEVTLATGQYLSTTAFRVLHANYIAEQEPAHATWYLDNVEFYHGRLPSRTSEALAVAPPTCSPNGAQVRVEIEDGLGAIVSSSATLPVRGGTPVSISITDGFLCSGDFYAPLVSAPLSVSISSPCIDGSQPTSYNWSVQYPNGVIDTGSSSEAFIDRTSLTVGDVVSIEFSSPGLGVLGSRDIIMCDASCQAESMLCDSAGVVASLPLEVRELRVLEHIIATLDRLISSIFNDVIPGWFPLPTPSLITALADYLPSDVIVGLEGLDHALSSSKVADYEKEVRSLRSLVQTMKNEDEAHFLNRMINLSDAYIHHYSTIEDGGAEAWNDLAFINGWDKSDINPLMAARAAIEHGLAVWLNACERNVEFTADGLPPKLDDEELMVRAFEAASLGVPRTLIEEHIVAK
ncbi:hypothetical protein FRC96_16630 [Lujinxingia vulgaris]|uniref:Uncharacterized protein n=1 Tax=Lujinxingia vulgaris TaxID=2600176 RepID=A0A5C6WVP7_9DELT|nr:hypothetical protein [Lujinxingia vulgaris]TXD32711.1 hypothetical protein FRC96_16630 [Lujinxingia vulgaris]